MSGCEVRALTADDAADYKALFAYACGETPTAFMVAEEEAEALPLERLERMLAGTPPTFGAFAGARIIGLAALRGFERRREKHKGRIGPVYVHPDWRGKGIARGLMIAALTEAKRGFEQVTLGVEKNNAAAYKLYESLGFTAYGTEARAIKISDVYYDMVQMVKQL